MADEREGPLIGALLAVPYTELLRRTQAGLAAAGFDDLRPAHTPVFQLLPTAGCRVTELAERAGMTKQAMGYLVDYLEERGYVERAPDPGDGRAQLVRRTARGRAVNRAARQGVEEIQAEWTGLLGEARMAQLLGLLRDLARGLGVADPGGAPDSGARRR